MTIWQSIPQDWQLAIKPWLQKASFQQLEENYAAVRASGVEIYPPQHCMYAALQRTPFSRVRAVLLGQDPYHEPGQAMGLAFAVPSGVKRPPSLRNLLKEYESDLGTAVSPMASIDSWTDAGVLLWNTALSVEAHKARSHHALGWNCLTTAILQAVNAKEIPVAFLLFGGDAAQYAELISPRHIVFRAPHPSPLSAHRGFFGCRPFSTVNRQLTERGGLPIDWSLAQES